MLKLLKKIKNEKGDDSVVVCKLANDGRLLVENVYNDAPNPQFVDEMYVSIGLSNQAFVLNQGVFTCSFTRIIQNEQYVNKFFDLNSLYYAFLAKGPLNAAGKLVFV